MMRIAIDAMGGDRGPRDIIAGALAAARHLPIGLVLVGARAEIGRELERHPDHFALDVQVVDADDVVGMAEAPAAALRRKPRASIKVAVETVARGDAAAVFSAGNTGATVIAAYTAFGMLPGVDRPALATAIPTRLHPAILLDAGANAECRPSHLVQFAAMGTVYARIALGILQPRIALLSIGEEETKGNDLTREAHRLLKARTPNFIGNIEARDVYTGEADVIVCDGFTGNIALKISEGLVEMVEGLLGDELARSTRAATDSLARRRAFRRLRKRVDYSEYGGAPLVGVAGLSIVGHGRSSVKAVRNAVVMAHRFATGDFVRRVEQEIATVGVPGE
jgi:glycerol-3-phosphate acyltransferase PlsX